MSILCRNEIIQHTIREGKHTYTFVLDVQRAFVTVLHNGLRELGDRGRMWRDNY